MQSEAIDGDSLLGIHLDDSFDAISLPQAADAGQTSDGKIHCHGTVIERKQTAPEGTLEMTSDTGRGAHEAWDARACEALIAELWTLRESMLEHEARLQPWLRVIAPRHAASASNLAHYLALRRFDLRRLQERLAWIGVSSLGRAETHVLANLDKVLGILHRLAGRAWTPRRQDEPAGFRSGRALLEQHAEELFGAAPAERRVRIMVTLPSEAAHDDSLVASLVAIGHGRGSHQLCAR